MGSPAGAALKSIHVLRKPCSAPTVAANVLRHGTGGLNINTTRIAPSNPSDLDSHRKMVEAIKSRGGHMAHSWKNSSDLSGANDVSTAGRWPANLVLQHLDGCVQDGSKTVKGAGHYPSARSAGSQISGPSGHTGQADLTERHLKEETVVAWTCAEGCPVAALDAQSGVSKSTGGRIANISTSSTIYGGGKGLGQALDPYTVRGDPGYGDKGGASRFFKQVGGHSE